MRYPILLHPDERLRKKAQPVTEITDELIQLLDDLHETMIAHDGVGLAAPQVGIDLQVAVVEVEEDDLFELINPVIISQKGSEIDVEGCLSIPHTYGTVDRSAEIVVRYHDREGDEMEVEAAGYLARALLHEIDHLKGVLFIDKMITEIPEEKLAEYLAEMEEDAND